MFFSFDGLDGAGKSTQIDRFCAWLRELGKEVVPCRDPGSTPRGEAVRTILLDAGPELTIGRTSEMLLYMAARAQLVDEVVRPALARGACVVSDRFLLANLVYQGYAGGLDVEGIRAVGRIATGGLEPDLTFLLDMPVAEAQRRLNRPLDRMERQGEAYRERLRAGYLAEAGQDARIVVVDATESIERVQTRIRAAAEHLLRGV